MDKDKQFIKEIKIDKKRRFKYNCITLIIFNILLLTSLIYLSLHIRHIVTYLVSIVIFAFCVVRSVRTVLNTKFNRRYVIYRDKITIQTTTFNGEVPLKNVFMIKTKRNLFDFIFKKGAHMIIVYAKTTSKQTYILPFIGEDTTQLADEIMKLAIAARAKDKVNLVVKTKRIINKTENNKTAQKQTTKKTTKKEITKKEITKK